jgi:hypothetical protein
MDRADRAAEGNANIVTPSSGTGYIQNPHAGLFWAGVGAFFIAKKYFSNRRRGHTKDGACYPVKVYQASNQ